MSLEDHSIFYPHALTVNSQLDIAVMAWNKRETYIFKNGVLSNSTQISTRKGRGPGEYEFPFDMYLTDEGLLWISDIGLRKIEVWDINANHLNQTFTLRNIFTKPDQIVSCNRESLETKSIYVLSAQYGYGYEKKDGMMYKYIENGKNLDLVNTFQKLSEDEERYPYVITGDLACTDDGGVIYSGDFTGSIRRYNKDGDIMYYRTAADVVVEEPLFFKLSEDVTRYNPEAPRINGEIFINEKNQLLVSQSRSRSRAIFGVDVYSVDTGAYEYSFRTPHIAKEIAIVGNTLLSIEKRGEEGYDMKRYEFETE